MCTIYIDTLYIYIMYIHIIYIHILYICTSYNRYDVCCIMYHRYYMYTHTDSSALRPTGAARVVLRRG